MYAPETIDLSNIYSIVTVVSSLVDILECWCQPLLEICDVYAVDNSVVFWQPEYAI